MAILPVILYHARLGCPGGFVGVDVFLVISGFLIASILIREIDGGTYSALDFWERRIRRIVPALAVVVVATWAAGWLLFLPMDFKSVGTSIAVQPAMAANVVFWRDARYFSPDLETKPLLHTWSLAVEEQFYVGFPLLLVLLAKYRRVPRTMALAGLVAGSFALSVYGSHWHPTPTFYLLPTRAWELLVGALLATSRGRMPIVPAVREAAGWGGLGLVLYSVARFDDQTRFPGLAALVPCIGAALILLSSEGQASAVGRILGWRPFVFVGWVSYSLYLWHWPVLAFAKYQSTGQQGVAIRAAWLLASFGLAVVCQQRREIRLISTV